MLNYIATEETSKLIKRISENQNILNKRNYRYKKISKRNESKF